MALSTNSSKKTTKKDIETQVPKRIDKNSAFIYADTYLPGSQGLQKLIQSNFQKSDAIFLEGIEANLSLSFSSKGDCLWGASLWRAQAEGENITTLSVAEVIDNFLNTNKKKTDSKTQDKKDKKAEKLPELYLKSFLQTFTHCISQQDNLHLIQNLSGNDNNVAGTPRWEMYFDLFHNAKRAGISIQLLDLPFLIDNPQVDLDGAASTIAQWSYTQTSTDEKNNKDAKKLKPQKATEPRQAHILLGLPLCQSMRLALIQNNVEATVLADDEWSGTKANQNNLIEATLRKGFETLYSVDPDNIREITGF